MSVSHTCTSMLDLGKSGATASHAVDQIVAVDDAGVLARHQQDMPEAPAVQLGRPQRPPRRIESVRRAMSLPAEKPQ